MNKRTVAVPRSAAGRFITSLLLLCLLIAFIAPVGVAAGNKPLVTTPDGLLRAIAEAQPGDVIYVGDIDFTPKDGIPNKLMRITLDRSVTIKSGVKNTPAVFTNGSFKLHGSKNASERLVCRFENIIFDGGTDGGTLTEKDWELPYSESLQEYTSDEPLRAQYAITAGGNTDVTFSGCDFRNYMFTEGGALRCYYGDYSADANLLAMLGDYTACNLNIRLEKCDFTGNSAYYGGGAVYLDGYKGNIALTAEDCSFTGNRSAAGQYSSGGGAIYASGTKITLSRCTVRNNTANHTYSAGLPESDTTHGGGICCNGSELSLTDCLVADNTASVGGGLSLTDTNAAADGCIIAGNSADINASNPAGITGPWSNMGLGGALYYSSVNVAALTVVNTSICGNTAENAYGGIYPFYNNDYVAALPHGFGSVSLLFCSYAGNTCGAEYDYSADMFDWYQRPGDVFAIPYVRAYACLIIDDTFVRDFPRYEAPSQDNDYNYFASPARADTDGLTVEYSSADGYTHYIPDTPPALDLRVPDGFAGSVLNGKYGTGIKKPHTGSNYLSGLYPPDTSPDITLIIAALCGAAVLACIIVIPIVNYRRRKTAEADVCDIPVPEPENTDTATVPVFMSRYTYEQIDALLADIPEAALLTVREREVIRETLSGKQQLEIARELGIEVTTVKDFNRKIYDKFGVPNKKKLIEKVGAVYYNKH